MGFFDDSKNSIGTLCTRLSNDATNVQGVSSHGHFVIKKSERSILSHPFIFQAGGSKIGIILQSVCSLSVSSIISLVLCWKMALLGMCAIPMVLMAAYIQCMIIMGQSAVEMKSLDKANKVIHCCG